MRLAAALVHDPEVLILDEPLNGTDPRQRIEFQNLMHREGQQGRTILISSHILEEVETLAGAILLIVSGKLAAAGDFRAIREKLEERPFQVRVLTAEPRAVAAALMAIPAVDSVEVTRDGALIVLSRDIGTLQRSIPQTSAGRGRASLQRRAVGRIPRQRLQLRGAPMRYPTPLRPPALSRLRVPR